MANLPKAKSKAKTTKVPASTAKRPVSVSSKIQKRVIQTKVESLQVGDFGAEVVNLQDALLALLNNKVITARDGTDGPKPEELQTLSETLKSEREKQQFGSATEALVKYFQIQHDLGEKFKGVVEKETAAKLNEKLKELGLLDETVPFVIRGVVKDSNGKPQPYLAVIAYDKDLRKETQLGERTATDANGAYRIEYAAKTLSSADNLEVKRSLLVRLYSKSNNKPPIAESAIRFNPFADEVVDFTVAAPIIAEWDLINDTILPRLQAQSDDGKPLNPADLTPSDLEFLAKGVEIDRKQLSLWSLAIGLEGLASKRIADPNEKRLLPAVYFYSWLRDDKPQNLTDLIKIPTETLLSSIEKAVKNNYISALDKKQLDETEIVVNQLRLLQTLKPAGEGEPASLGDVLTTIEAEWLKDKLPNMVEIALKVDHKANDFLELAKASGLTKTQSIQLRQTMYLGEISKNHIPVIKALQPKLVDEKEGSIKSLVTLTPNDWLNLAYEHGTPPQDNVTRAEYADALQIAVEKLMPHEVLKSKLESGSLLFTAPKFSGVQAAFAEHPEFNIATTNIDLFADDKKIAPDTTSALKKLQHLNRLNARWDEASTLINIGIDDAEEITNFGKDQFKAMLKGQLPEQRLEAIYNQANALKAVSIGLLGKIQPLLHGVSPAVMADRRLAIHKNQIEENATLRKLFGALDNCASDPCLSVLSPAAYLADLLTFIDASPAVRNELEKRRPDIFDLELSCDNSNIELPQIDLAIEILENAVVFPPQMLERLPTITLPPSTDVNAELSEGQVIGKNILDALQKTSKDKLDNPKAQKDILSQIPHWQIIDKHRTWAISAMEETVEFGRFPIDTKKFTQSDAIKELDSGKLPNSLWSEISSVLKAVIGINLTPSRKDFSEIKIEKLSSPTHSSLQSWEFRFALNGLIVIDTTNGTLSISWSNGEKNELSVTENLLKEFQEDLDKSQITSNLISFLSKEMFRERIKINEFEVTPNEGNRWNFVYTGSMEFRFRPASIKIKSLTYQSTAADRDLATKPQNINPLAYTKLAGDEACFPWSLPYDLDLNKARETLKVAGVPRLSLLEIATPIENRNSSKEIAAERLGLSRGEVELIATPEAEENKASKKLLKVWGLSASNQSQEIRDTFSDSDLANFPFGNDGLLTRVSILLQQCGLNFAEFDSLLECQFINPDAAISIPVDSRLTCKPAEMRINRSEESDVAPFLDRLHRFVRLWRATGWEVWELDLALRANGIGGSNLNADAVVHISNLEELRRRLNLPIDVLVSMIGGFTNTHYIRRTGDQFQKISPLYDRLFQNRQLADPPAVALAFSEGLPELDEPLKELIAASVGISKAEILLLLKSEDIDPKRPELDGTSDKKRQLLHWLFRNVRLAQSVGLSIYDYATAWHLNPAGHFRSSSSLLIFLDELEYVKNSGFSWGELAYLLNASKVNPNASSFELTIQRGNEIISSLRRELKNLLSPGPVQLPVELVATVAQMAEPWVPSQDQVRLLASTLGIEIKDCVRLGEIFEMEGRIPWKSKENIFDFASATISYKQRVEVVTLRLAEAFSLDREYLNAILWDCVTSPGNDSRSAMQYLISKGFINAKNSTVESESRDSTAFEILSTLAKIALLTKKWKLSLTELNWFVDKTKTKIGFDGLVFNSLTSSQAVSGNMLQKWKQSTALFQIVRTIPKAGMIIGAYIGVMRKIKSNDELKAVHVVLAESFSLSETIVRACAFRLNMGKTYRFLEPLQFASLFGLLGTVQKLGLDHENLDNLISKSSSLASSDTAAKLLKARFGESGWSKALRQITDSMRMQQRDRLVDFLLAREGLRGASALYAYYLIDFEMSPCMMTTRILQSTATVQLFVQRCLFNLERPYVTPDKIVRKHWEWMQNYRVWEANRKVFLYPENWLFPEVRDDRTETFKAFEGALAQNQPSHEHAVNSLNTYLDCLVDISQIAVLGACVHVRQELDELNSSDEKVAKTLYLIGRSPSIPHIYYWRKAQHYAEEGTRWTGWERINQDIASEFVIPFVFNEQLYLSWVGITKRREGDSIVKIKMNWMKRLSSGWDKVSVSQELEIPHQFPELEPSNSMLFSPSWIAPSDGTVDVNVWSETQLSNPILGVCEARSQITRTTPPQTSVRNIYLDLSIRVTATLQLDDTKRQIVLNSDQVEVRIIGLSNFIEYNSSYFRYDFGAQLDLDSFEKSFQLYPPSGGIVKIAALYRGINIESEFAIDAPSAQGGDEIRFNVDFTFHRAMDPQFVIPGGFENTGFLAFDGEGWTWIQHGGNVKNIKYALDGFSYSQNGERETDYGRLGYDNLIDSSKGGLKLLRTSASLSSRAGDLSTDVLREGESQFVITRTGNADVTTKEAVYLLGFPDAKRYKNISGGNIEGLFQIKTQRPPTNLQFNMSELETYLPIQLPIDPRNMGEQTHFELIQPNALYNWEVFYHLPIAAAIFLSRQQRFEEARRWFHFVFDPTTNDASTGRERFWRFLPFHNSQVPDTITLQLEILGGKSPNNQEKTKFGDEVKAWLENPFNPYAVARLRPSAFEWYTVVAYIKNLISWADQLFRRDTRESINEATLLYVMAIQILGPRPETIPNREDAKPLRSFRSLKVLKSEGFSNTWLSLAETTPYGQLLLENEFRLNDEQQYELAHLSSIGSLYFNVPTNEKLPELWDMVDDRLFKIRHCQNVDGVRRTLPLYEPPIDPGLLIRAKAAGMDLADVLADRFAPLPHYRFQVLLQKANEFCAEVKSLGSAIVTAIEKKESEYLILLRSSQEIDMLKRVESIKQEQISEADANIQSLNKTRKNTLDRFAFLQRQLGKNEIAIDATGAPNVEQTLVTQVQVSGTPLGFGSLSLIPSEVNQIANMDTSIIFSDIAGIHRFIAGTTHLVGLYPAAKPFAEAAGFALSATADALGTIGNHFSYLERRNSQMAAWQRRRDEWVQQSKMTAEEIRQIDKQIIALQIRKSIASKELENHRKQIEHARNIDDYMRHLKFSGESFYGWMESQLSGLYFSAYQMAYDLAKKAERAYQFELGEPSSNFIQYGHWDSLRKGLLSGERLSQNLRRLESAHLERNKRELEITKHISLRQVKPTALMSLRNGEISEFTISESLFDLDFPGHYFRRIKSVSISVPCVVGPYASVSGTLRLLSSKLRVDTLVRDGVYDKSANYQDSFLPTQAIATSSGQNDSGLFELNFRDERYLPFEGAGAIDSKWEFELPREFASFDYKTISDVILHIRYTARDGGQQLANAARADLSKEYSKLAEGPLALLLSVRHDFPEQWAMYRSSTEKPLELLLTDEHFPFQFRKQTQIGGEIQWYSDQGATISVAGSTVSGRRKITVTDPDPSLESAYLIVPYGITPPQN
jgi:Tc toxin complex TcA C-terminal TcB-binding domain/Neuraminidase-like domain